MNTPLAEHLRAGAALPFVWGKRDCVLFACDWVERQRGVDPLIAYRGRYGTALGARRHIVKAGGFLNLISAAMAGAGLPETDDPLPGDIGVVMTDQGEALAICTPVGWAAKGPSGIVASRFPMLKAWSV